MRARWMIRRPQYKSVGLPQTFGWGAHLLIEGGSGVLRSPFLSILSTETARRSFRKETQTQAVKRAGISADTG